MFHNWSIGSTFWLPQALQKVELCSIFCIGCGNDSISFFVVAQCNTTHATCHAMLCSISQSGSLLFSPWSSSVAVLRVSGTSHCTVWHPRSCNCNYATFLNETSCTKFCSLKHRGRNDATHNCYVAWKRAVRLSFEINKSINPGRDWHSSARFWRDQAAERTWLVTRCARCFVRIMQFFAWSLLENISTQKEKKNSHFHSVMDLSVGRSVDPKIY